MSSLAVSSLASDVRRAELERHIFFARQFLRRLERAEELRDITMVLRSASSGPALAIIQMARELSQAKVSARIIVARLEPKADLMTLFESLRALSPTAPAKELLRWARNPRLLDAHEQASYGERMCWSGDQMRREADKKNALSLFTEDALEAPRLARSAFAALWQTSSPIAEQHLVKRGTQKPSGSYNSDASRLARLALFRTALLGWPVIRH
jgi:hypothetical protein